LIESQEYKKPDIVFVTDGQAPVASKFLAKFLETKKAKEFRVFGVPIQTNNVSTPEKFSDELIHVSGLLDTEAMPLLEM